jgi:hypothetical protein
MIAALLLLLTQTVAAAPIAPDPRGWSHGTTAANAAALLAGPQERAVIEVPEALAKRVKGPTVLFYFSPTCPHCTKVAGEVDLLATRLKERGTALLAISSGMASEAQINTFKALYQTNFVIIHDTTGDIVASIAARSTPSALLVEPAGPKNKLRIIDLWYPYQPGFDGLIEGRAAGDLWAVFQGGRYLGNNLCAGCHTAEAQSYALTHHAMAWRTLVDAGSSADPKCTGCHVTGSGEAGGWAGDPESKLVGVGCESCHGPSGPHDGTPTEPRDTCTACHDADHSIAFSYEKGLPMLDHYRAEGMSDDDYRDAAMALYKGEVPRALLAFPDGPTVGAAACASCHPSEHATWQMSSHATAMNRLADKGADDTACVGCHATPLATGVKERTVAEHRLEESVACESCHGPGQAHVQSGGAPDTIQGLGDSCPVCVIEAICTSCHTPSQHPDWNLERDLKRVSHGLKR